MSININSLKTLKQQIDKVEVVSFDIFDTLITRNFISPTEVFTDMKKEVFELTNGEVSDFRRLRMYSEKQAMENAKKLGKEDVNLDDIYNFFTEHFKIDSKTMEQIKMLEMEKEFKNIIPRESGVQLFFHALQKGKKVILISDMYLPKDFIESFLSHHKITGYHKFYLSQEVGKRKHEGSLYKHVLSDLSISADNIIHIGDNAIGDIKRANENKIMTYHLVKSNDIFSKKSQSANDIHDYFTKNRTLHNSLMLKPIIDKFFDEEHIIKKDTLFNNDRFNFGFMALGPIVFSFSLWLRKQLINNNIKKVFFLSRDGKVFKDAFDELFGSEFETEYIFASRFISKTTRINSRPAIWETVYEHIYNTDLKTLFKYRLGLQEDDLNIEVLSEFGVSKETILTNSFNRDKLYQIALAHEDRIYEISSEKNQNYIDYLKQKGFDSDKIAIVDIGYAGTMQSYFTEAFPNTDIMGFYLGTLNEGLIKLKDTNKAKGFVTDYSSKKDDKNIIQTHRFLLETIICSEDDSFLYMDKADDEFLYHFSTTETDEERKKFIYEAHSGAINYINEIMFRINDDYIRQMVLPGDQALYILETFFKYPELGDINIFEGLVFEDTFGPKEPRYIITGAKDIKKIGQGNIIWKEGLNKLKNVSNKAKKTNTTNTITHNIEFMGLIPSIFYSFEKMFTKTFLEERKYDKLLTNREAFFVDSKKPVVQKYFKLTRHFG